MQSENLLHINLAHADEAAKRLDIELTDRFFADLEQEEISGGDVHADLLFGPEMVTHPPPQGSST